MGNLKNYFVMFLFCALFVSCSNSTEPNDENIIKVNLQSSKVYSYDTGIGGDEEGAVITMQAEHFEISEIVRNSSTGGLFISISRKKDLQEKIMSLLKRCRVPTVQVRMIK